MVFWNLAAPCLCLALLAVFFRLPSPQNLGAAAALSVPVLAGLFFASPESALAALACAAGVFGFERLFQKFRANKLAAHEGALAKALRREEEEKLQNQTLKKEWERAEHEIVRTLNLYGTMKGMGEALAWDEMIPHIDFAVQKALGFKDYHLYLSDEQNAFQRMILRGARLQELPAGARSEEPQWHETASEAYAEIPIRQGDEKIGLLWVRTAANATALKEVRARKDEILRESLDLAEGLAMGLQKARLFSSIEKLSRIDGLTGVYRRQFFNDRLENEIRRAKTFRTAFSVLIVDLDHFKNINDTYGHQAGDEVLKRVGALFKESVYETDFVARYGGEEFVILFPQADPTGVIRKAEALRQRISEQEFTFGFNKIRVTASMGISHFPLEGQDSATLLQRADQRLYQAKDGGRNRVVGS